MSEPQTLMVNEVKYVREDAQKEMVSKRPDGAEYCIVRTSSAGVFAGWVDRSFDGQAATVYDARRLWYWDGAASLSQLAMEGVKSPENCKFPCPVREVDLKQIVEVIPCSQSAKSSIDSVEEWKR